MSGGQQNGGPGGGGEGGRGPGKKTLSDSEVVAYNKNRFADRSLRHMVRQLRAQEQESRDRSQREIYRWRDFMKRSVRTTGAWFISPFPEDEEEELSEVGGDQQWGSSPGRKRSPSPSRHKMDTSTELARSLNIQNDALSRLQKPWAYTYTDTSHNSIYKEAEEIAKGQEKRLFLRRSTSTSIPVPSSSSSGSSSNSPYSGEEKRSRLLRCRSSMGVELGRGPEVLEGDTRPWTANPQLTSSTTIPLNLSPRAKSSTSTPRTAKKSVSVASSPSKNKPSFSSSSSSASKDKSKDTTKERPKTSRTAKLTASLTCSSANKNRPNTSLGVTRLNAKLATTPRSDNKDDGLNGEMNEGIETEELTVMNQGHTVLQDRLTSSAVNGLSRVQQKQGSDLTENVPCTSHELQNQSAHGIVTVTAENCPSARNQIKLPDAKKENNRRLKEELSDAVEIGFAEFEVGNSATETVNIPEWNSQNEPQDGDISQGVSGTRKRRQGVVVFGTSVESNKHDKKSHPKSSNNNYENGSRKVSGSSNNSSNNNESSIRSSSNSSNRSSNNNNNNNNNDSGSINNNNSNNKNFASENSSINKSKLSPTKTTTIIINNADDSAVIEQVLAENRAAKMGEEEEEEERDLNIIDDGDAPSAPNKRAGRPDRRKQLSSPNKRNKEKEKERSRDKELMSGIGSNQKLPIPSMEQGLAEVEETIENAEETIDAQTSSSLHGLTEIDEETESATSSRLLGLAEIDEGTENEISSRLHGLTEIDEGTENDMASSRLHGLTEIDEETESTTSSRVLGQTEVDKEKENMTSPTKQKRPQRNSGQQSPMPSRNKELIEVDEAQETSAKSPHTQKRIKTSGQSSTPSSKHRLTEVSQERENTVTPIIQISGVSSGQEVNSTSTTASRDRPKKDQSDVRSHASSRPVKTHTAGQVGGEVGADTQKEGGGGGGGGDGGRRENGEGGGGGKNGESKTNDGTENGTHDQDSNNNNNRKLSRRGTEFNSRSMTLARQRSERDVTSKEMMPLAQRGALTRRCSAIDVRRRGSILKFVDNLEALRDYTLGRLASINDDDDNGDVGKKNVADVDEAKITNSLPATKTATTTLTVNGGPTLARENNRKQLPDQRVDNNKENSIKPKNHANLANPTQGGQLGSDHTIPEISRPVTVTAAHPVEAHPSSHPATRPVTAPVPGIEQHHEDHPEHARHDDDMREVYPAGRGYPNDEGYLQDYVVFKGHRIWNYVRPQERYREERFLTSGRRERSLLRLSYENPECLQQGSRDDLFKRPPLIFPKSARRRVMHELVERNHQAPKTNEAGAVPRELRARIDEFFRSIEPYCPKPSLVLDDQS